MLKPLECFSKLLRWLPSNAGDAIIYSGRELTAKRELTANKQYRPGQASGAKPQITFSPFDPQGQAKEKEAAGFVFWAGWLPIYRGPLRLVLVGVVKWFPR